MIDQPVERKNVLFLFAIEYKLGMPDSFNLFLINGGGFRAP